MYSFVHPTCSGEGRSQISYWRSSFVSQQHRITLSLPRAASPLYGATSHSMKNLAFHSGWKMIISLVLTTLHILLAFKRLRECAFWTWGVKGIIHFTLHPINDLDTFEHDANTPGSTQHIPQHNTPGSVPCTQTTIVPLPEQTPQYQQRSILQSWLTATTIPGNVQIWLIYYLPATGGPSIIGGEENRNSSPNAGTKFFFPAMSPVRMATCTTKHPSCKPNIMLYASRDPNETRVGSKVVITLHTSRDIWYRYSRFTRGLSDSRPYAILPTVTEIAKVPTSVTHLALGIPRSCPCWTCEEGN